METQSTLLTWMIFLPVHGIALIILAFAARSALGLKRELLDNVARVIAMLSSAGVLALAFVLWYGFNPNAQGMQYVHHFVWIKSFNIEYFLGTDGISISMILLTALISFIACLASMPWWSKVDEHHFSRRMTPGFMALFLLLETGMMGVFCSLDIFLFYIFWELMLLPMYFLIGVWGGPRKEYAAIKFFLYTLAGSVLMLIAIIALYYNSGPAALIDGTPAPHSFNMLELARNNFSLAAPLQFGRLVSLPFAKVMWVLLFIGFAIKIPMFPFHTWLPDAHVEAPTPISVILAGILLKMGPYGILRVNFTILPDATRWAADAMAIFGVINIVYAAFVCMAQSDLKKLIAYSSVSHMGFVLLGMAAFTPEGISGAVLQMWNHGIISPMLFLIAGVIYDRAHHREIAKFGGLASQMPEYAGVTGIAFMASLGLPGLAGFISEMLCFLGAFPVYRGLTMISVLAVIITAGYYLWAMQRMFLGPLNPKYEGFEDLWPRERLTLYPLLLITVVMGFYPAPILDLINPHLFRLIQLFK